MPFTYYIKANCFGLILIFSQLKPNRRKLDPINLDALLLQEKVAYVQ